MGSQEESKDCRGGHLARTVPVNDKRYGRGVQGNLDGLKDCGRESTANQRLLFECLKERTR